MELTALCVPIFVAAVFVFIVSSILHMVVQVHKGDYKQLPGEDGILDAIRLQSVTPQTYMFPYCASMKEMGSTETVERFKRGPVGMITVMPNGLPAMGKNLGFWFLYSLITSLFVGYLATLANLGQGAEYMAVFRFTGTVAILAYGVSPMVDSIWKGQQWGVTFKFIFDGVTYGLVTAGTFAWLWPAGA